MSSSLSLSRVAFSESQAIARRGAAFGDLQAAHEALKLCAVGGNVAMQFGRETLQWGAGPRCLDMADELEGNHGSRKVVVKVGGKMLLGHGVPAQVSAAPRPLDATRPSRPRSMHNPAPSTFTSRGSLIRIFSFPPSRGCGMYEWDWQAELPLVMFLESAGFLVVLAVFKTVVARPSSRAR